MLSRRPLLVSIAASLVGAMACHHAPPATGATLAHDLSDVVRTARVRAAAGDHAAAERLLDAAARRTSAGTERDLVHGHIGARSAMTTVLQELAAVRAARGDTSGARAALDRFLFEAPDPDLLDSLQRSAAYAALGAMPGIEARTAELRALRRWRDDSAFTSPYRDTLPVEERVSGLSLVWAEMRYSFVGLGQQGEPNVDSVYRAALARVMRPMDTWEYYQEIERLLATVEDNHTDVMELPAPLRRHRVGIPVEVRRIEGKVMVLRVRSQAVEALGVQAGQEVLSIDGLSPDEHVRRRLPPQLAVHTPQATDVTTYGWRLFQGELGTSVSLRLRDRDGRERDVAIRRGGWTDLKATPVVEARSLSNGIGYLALNSFGDPRAIALIDSAMATLGELRGLIVDTRQNGGGSQDAGWHLLSQWLSAPYTQTEQFSSAYIGIWRAWGGGLVRVPMPARVVRPHPTIHRTIPLLWLVGPRTASAAEGVAALVEQTGVGTTVGEPTYGSTGQPILVPLPGGGRARVRVEEERFNDGRVYTRRGIRPMISVPMTVAGVRDGRDEVMEGAMAEMRRRLSPGR